MDDAIIATAGLVKRYGTFTAVDDVALRVDRGRLFGLLGPNGAGKTTLIRMLMGLLRPSAGSATIAGIDCFAGRAQAMRHVGYVPDDPYFHDYLTGRELVRFVAGMHGLDRATTEARATALTGRLGLTDDLGEFAVNYSKGMKKKLALVLALMHEPALLILDEPTNGLDPYATREAMELLRELTAQGRTVFFSTHLLDQVERLCDRVAIMSRGRIAAQGTIAELRESAGAQSLEGAFFAATGGTAAQADAPA